MENTLLGQEDNIIKFFHPKWYKINTDEIKDIQDIKNIFDALSIQFDETTWLNKIPEKYKTEVVDK